MIRLRRSELSTPATSTKMIAKAAASEADLAFLDLEDAVAPPAKEGARANIVAGLNELDWGTTVRAFRTNGVHTPWCHGDIIEVVSGAGANLDIVIVPKVKGPRDVWFVDDLLTQLERKHGLEVGRIGIEILIEEVEALAHVEEIAGCSPRLEALILGVGDLSASQGVRAAHLGMAPASGEGAGGVSYPGDLWHYARNRMIVAARAYGLDAIDGPYADFRDEAGYRQQAEWSAALGAVGKWCIHPAQVPICNEVYAPTQAEIDDAIAAIDAVREAEARGEGAAAVNGVMVDAATARVFEVTLDRARLCGLLDG
jgi:citrate lyase subunit beta / citryl-CoA lyase